MPALVAAANGEITLYAAPDGSAKETLLSGTVMQIFARDGDWYHVQIPGEAEMWPLNVPARYGYVRAEDVVVYDTPLCAKYGSQ